jgi:cytochrome c-type biogenesis protein CcmH
MLEGGKSYDDVIAYFVGKEGEVALSSPTKEGFNLVGYIMPFLAIIAAGSGVAVTATRWAKKGKSGNSSSSQEPVEEVDDEIADKLRKELEDFDS